MSMLVSAAAEVTEHFDTPFPPEVYGLGAFGGLMLLLGVTFGFRSVARRQRPRQTQDRH